MNPTRPPNQTYANQPCLARIRSLYPSLFEAEQKVADFIQTNPEECLNLTIAEIAGRANVATSTVNRFCQSLQYGGFKEFKLELAKDLVIPLHLENFQMSKDDSTETMRNKLFQADIQALVETNRSLSETELDLAAALIQSARRVDIYGVGSSVPIVLDLHYWMSRIGLLCNPCTDPNVQKIYASQANEETVSIGISHSGTTRNVIEALQIARKNGSRVIVYTNYARSPIVSFADHVLLTASQDTTLRNVSMTSRVAQLAVNDLLTLAVAHKCLGDAESTLQRTAEALIMEKWMEQD